MQSSTFPYPAEPPIEIDVGQDVGKQLVGLEMSCQGSGAVLSVGQPQWEEFLALCLSTLPTSYPHHGGETEMNFVFMSEVWSFQLTGHSLPTR